jgi:nucleoside-diphosphate-sugar epimerase
MTMSDTTSIGEMSTILVTGATGQHGSTGWYVAHRLREEGRMVRALVRQRSERTIALEKIGVDIVC